MRVGNSLWVLGYWSFHGYWSFLECYLFSIMMRPFLPRLSFRALTLNCIRAPGEDWCKDHKVLLVSMSNSDKIFVGRGKMLVHCRAQRESQPFTFT